MWQVLINLFLPGITFIKKGYFLKGWIRLFIFFVLLETIMLSFLGKGPIINEVKIGSIAGIILIVVLTEVELISILIRKKFYPLENLFKESIILYLQGKYKESYDILKKLITLHPFNPYYLYCFAVVSKKTGRSFKKYLYRAYLNSENTGFSHLIENYF